MRMCHFFLQAQDVIFQALPSPLRLAELFLGPAESMFVLSQEREEAAGLSVELSGFTLLGFRGQFHLHCRTGFDFPLKVFLPPVFDELRRLVHNALVVPDEMGVGHQRTRMQTARIGHAPLPLLPPQRKI